MEKFGDNTDAREEIISLKKALLTLMHLSMQYLFYHDDVYDKNVGVNEGNIVLKVDRNKRVIEAKFIDFGGDCEVGADVNKVKKMWCGVFSDLRDNYKAFKKISLPEEEIFRVCG